MKNTAIPMENSPVIQEQQDTLYPDEVTQDVRRTPTFFSAGAAILSVINLMICTIIEISLSFTYGWSAFKTEMIMGLLMAAAVFTLMFRGTVSFIISAGILAYLYIYHVAPFLFGT